VNVHNSTWPLASPVTHTQPSSPDFALLGSLPYGSTLELEACTTAPGEARKWLAGILREWSLPEFEDSVTLIASELVTNSVVATGKVAWAADRPPVRLWLHGGPSLVALLAWDAIATAPMPREAAEDDESGRGLFLIGELSGDWGFCYPEDIGGKITWAVIKIP
jgi:anti-sigma regulatory factor (Ser/Thr protein kinase)